MLVANGDLLWRVLLTKKLVKDLIKFESFTKENLNFALVTACFRGKKESMTTLLNYINNKLSHYELINGISPAYTIHGRITPLTAVQYIIVISAKHSVNFCKCIIVYNCVFHHLLHHIPHATSTMLHPTHLHYVSNKCFHLSILSHLIFNINTPDTMPH